MRLAHSRQELKPLDAIIKAEAKIVIISFCFDTIPEG
jgi:hypothetical protein